MIRAAGLTYTYPGGGGPALAGVDLAVGPGQCLGLAGPSGSGKTTLLLALAGLLEGGRLEGELTLNGGRRPRVGVVMQNPESQVLCTTVADEAAFAPRAQGLGRAETAARVEEALERVGLHNLASRNVERLSLGQLSRLNLAAVLTMAPEVILLDEPTAQLDAAGRERLVAILAGLKAEGRTLVLAEHNHAAVAGIVDQWAVCRGARGLEHRDAPPQPPVPPSPGETPRRPAPPAGGPVLAARGLGLPGADGRPLFSGLDLELYPGELVSLTGPNGQGKSSLLRCLAGGVAPDQGVVLLEGRAPRPGRDPGRLGLLMQNPVRQLFEETCRAEVAFTLRRRGLRGGDLEQGVTRALALCEAEGLAGRAPMRLSFGEQHRVALAAAAAPAPRALLLDEPFAGLDFGRRLRLLGALSRLRDTLGTSVLLASHDPLIDPHWADRGLRLEGGGLAHA